jgi:hypothetical protein
MMSYFDELVFIVPMFALLRKFFLDSWPILTFSGSVES